MKKERVPLSDHAKGTIKIVFLTLFLDLVGFSIIFPLFPSLADYYLQVDGDNFFLKFIFQFIATITGGELGDAQKQLVLFGGVLGGLYSLLQFIAAPIWGTISDRIGRRPVLLISIAGLALSYLLWFFSGSFTLLILARFIGGIMGGNISTATAVISDVTKKENRASGMAFVGIAFATGFIMGPALGGLMALVRIDLMFVELQSLGVNPFSGPAALAFVLSLINFVWVYFRFRETLPVEKRGKGVNHRSMNPIQLMKPLPYPGLNLTNFSYFLFLMAFSGMEFTLTFLAVERLNYSSLQNAYMFIFIGVLLAIIQGGYVRRKAHQVGEKKMAMQGMIAVIPGLFILSKAHSHLGLYGGLFFLAVGSAMIVPCLTSLVSLYTPPEQQGKSLGIFRSLGALARVFGPFFASLIYWRSDATLLYQLGAIFTVVPIILVARLPKPQEQG